MADGTAWRANARWHLKRVARRVVTAASDGTRHDLSIRALRGSCIRVLTYHRFGQPGRDPFCVHPESFEAQMAWLAGARLAVSLDDVDAHLAGERPLADDGVLVTIDDGCESLLAIAAPILRRWAIPAVAFLSAGEVGEPASASVPERRLDWSELARVTEYGITVGSHSWSHRSLARLDRGGRLAELECARVVLERRLGRPVTALAYPFGTVADYDAHVADDARAAGYRHAFTARHGAIRAHADPFTLPRVKVEGGDDLRLFRSLVRGGLDAWRLVDENLWWAQARS